MLQSCGNGTVDWAPAAVSQVEQLARMLAARNVGCADFQLQDRELLSRNQHYVELGVPGALGQCTIGPDHDVHIASFRDSPTTLEHFTTGETRFICAASPALRVVTGPDWAVFIPKGEAAAGVAATLDGVAGTSCR